MKRFCVALIFMLLYLASEAQVISGRVIDSKGAPIENANVILNNVDSTFVDVVLTDSVGAFSFQQRKSEFRLIVQHMAYHSREILCQASMVGDIILEEKEAILEGFEIVAERPLVRIEEGRLAYDLGQLTKDKVVNNTYEALKKLPGVREEQEKLTLVGASSLSVIINGKPSTMTYEQVVALLKSTPVERVNKVEVMYSAPPHYHVRGAALNIVLKKDTQYSLQGEVGADYINRIGSSGGAHAFLRLASPRQAIDVMYNASLVEDAQDLDMLSMHTFAGKVHDIRQLQEIREKVWLHNARASYEYNFNERNSLSVAYTGQFKDDGESSVSSVGNFRKSHSRKVVDMDNMHNFSLQAYTGIGLSAGADFTLYETRTRQNMSVDCLNDTVLVMGQNAGQKIRSLNLYADQKHTLGKGWTLGYGASYRNCESEDYQHFSEESTLAGSDVNSSLSEHTAEAYVLFGRQSPMGLSFSFTATAEYYRINDRVRWTIYPQGSITYMRNPDHILQGSLYVNKLYPSYWQMQDAVGYLDGYAEMHNTPGLEPSKLYSLNANYIYKQKYMFGLFSNYIDKMFAQTIYQSPDRLALIYQTLNWDYLAESGIMAVIPYTPVQWFDTRATLVGLYISQRCDNFFDIGFENKRWAGIFSLDNSFRVNEELVFELNGFVQTPVTQGTFSVETMWSVSAGAKWNFDDGKGTLSCFFNDIFNSTVGTMTMDFHGQNLVNENNFYTRNLTLSFTYRFGGYKKKEGREIDTSRFGH